MSGSDGSMNEPAGNQVISCEEILFRAILKRKHLSANGGAEVEVFLLSPKDGGRLSLRRKALISLLSFKGGFSKCYGAVTLHAGRVREVRTVVTNLDVIIDEDPEDPLPGHASLINLPDPELDVIQAERIATLLRDQCRTAAEG